MNDNNMNQEQRSRGPFAPPRYANVLRQNVQDLAQRAAARGLSDEERGRLLGMMDEAKARLAAFVG